MPNVISENTVIGDVVVYEEPAHYSRDTVTVRNGAGNLKPGSVLGKKTKNTVSEAADGGNTGNGTIGDATLGAKAKVGTYTFILESAAADAGTFKVFDPDGFRLDDYDISGGAYSSDHVNVTISDGSTDFVVGDKFTVTVSGDGKYDLAADGAVDGLADAVGVLLEEVDASGGDVTGALILSGDAIVSEQALIYDSSVDNAAKRQAMKDGLANVGIKVTEGA